MNQEVKNLQNETEWTHEKLFTTDFAVLFAEDLPAGIIEWLKTDWFGGVSDLLLAGRDGMLEIFEYEETAVKEIERAMARHNLSWASVTLIDGKKLDCTELKYAGVFADRVFQTLGICTMGDLIGYTEKQLWQIFYDRLIAIAYRDDITVQESIKRKMCERVSTMHIRNIQKSLQEWQLQLKPDAEVAP